MNTNGRALRIENLIRGYFMEFDKAQRAMAASPESLLYCLEFIELHKMESVLDAGSGLSSVLFHDQLPNVSTVDDNPAWRQKTSELLLKLLDKNISITDINSTAENSFDFVFYDYGDIETRIFYFKKALSMTKHYMYIDDMHVDFYHGYIKSRSKPYGFKIVEETKDEFGRFGAILAKH